MKTWTQMQEEVSRWATSNFGDGTTPELLMLGIIEEVGEYYACQASNLEDMAERREKLMDSLGDQAIYAVNLCQMVGILFGRDVAQDERNRPQYLTDRQLLGSLALGCRAILKTRQGIRRYNWDRRRDEVQISLGMWYRWAQAQTKLWALPEFLETVRHTWEQVRTRDWKRNPADAAEIASAQAYQHAPRLDTRSGDPRRHVVVGCNCGWRVPDGAQNPDDAFANHLALVSVMEVVQ